MPEMMEEKSMGGLRRGLAGVMPFSVHRGAAARDQLALFDEPSPLARRSDPVTSHLAAASAKDLQQQHQRLIVAALKQHGPLGKDGIAARTKLTGVAVARRTVELQRAGLIKPTGKTVASSAGRPEREWEAV